MKRLRVAMVGTGVAARKLHWPALQKLNKHYQVVALCNRSRPKAEDFADLIGLDRSQVTTDYEEILKRPDVDAVILIVPPQFNRPLAEQAAAAGKPVIAEKPIANTLEDAQAILELPARHGVPVLIAENFRYGDRMDKIKSILNDGAIGRLFLISWQFVFSHGPEDAYVNTGWRQQPEHPGGFLGDVNVHTVDGLRYLAGEIEQVHCLARDVRPWLGGYDAATFNFQFRSGVMANLTFANAAATSQPMALALYGTEGTIDATWDQVTLRRPGRKDQVHAIKGPGSYVREYEDFYQVLAKGKPPKMTLEDAKQDLAVILAAVHSAETGEVVRVEIG